MHAVPPPGAFFARQNSGIFEALDGRAGTTTRDNIRIVQLFVKIKGDERA